MGKKSNSSRVIECQQSCSDPDREHAPDSFDLSIIFHLALLRHVSFKPLFGHKFKFFFSSFLFFTQVAHIIVNYPTELLK